jgi:hypothetical protein
MDRSLVLLCIVVFVLAGSFAVSADVHGDSRCEVWAEVGKTVSRDYVDVSGNTGFAGFTHLKVIVARGVACDVEAGQVYEVHESYLSKVSEGTIIKASMVGKEPLTDAEGNFVLEWTGIKRSLVIPVNDFMTGTVPISHVNITSDEVKSALGIKEAYDEMPAPSGKDPKLIIFIVLLVLSLLVTAMKIQYNAMNKNP